VGKNGTGALSVESGGVVSNTDGYIGSSITSTGEVTVSGSNSQWNNSDELRVGVSGSGILSVEAGGRVSSSGGYIGTEPDSTGEVTVTGANSQWNDLNSLGVGDEGFGTLNVMDGGSVTMRRWPWGSIIGYLSTGEVTVTSAAKTAQQAP